MAKKKSLLLVLAALIAGGGTAVAQDKSAAPGKPASKEKHFYAGLYGGTSSTDVGWNYVSGGNSVNGLSPDGGFGGVDVGAGTRLGRVYLALEGDASFGSFDSAKPCPNPSYSCHVHMSGFRSLRGIAGVPLGDFTPYVTAGFARADLRAETIVGSSIAGDSETTSGLAAGAGLSYRLRGDWSVRAEYIHYSFEARRYRLDGGLEANVDAETDTVRAGVNYAF